MVMYFNPLIPVFGLFDVDEAIDINSVSLVSERFDNLFIFKSLEKAVNTFREGLEGGCKYPEFEAAIESVGATLLIPKVDKEILKLNYYTVVGDASKVIESSKELRPHMLNQKQKSAYYSLMFGYYINTGDFESAAQVIRVITEDPDFGSEMGKELLRDCQLVYDVYVKKDTSRLETISCLAQASTDSEIKAVYQFRLALLYEELGDNRSYCEQLEKALRNTSAPALKSEIASRLAHRDKR